MVATSLALILTLVNFAVSHRHRPVDARLARGAVWRLALSSASGNAFKFFGMAVVAGVLWQRVVGTVFVSPLVAAVLVAALAGLITILVERWTRLELLRPLRRAAPGWPGRVRVHL